MKESLSIIIPCYNEEEGIPNLKKKLTWKFNKKGGV